MFGHWTADDEKLHQRVLDHLRTMTDEEVFEAAVKAGIYTLDGDLTPPYRESTDGELAAYAVANDSEARRSAGFPQMR